MKQLMRVLLVMMLVLTMVAPAFAAPVGFVGSVESKPVAGLLPLGTCEHGVTAYGWLIDEDGNKHCLCGKELIVTPLYQFQAGTHPDILPDSVAALMFEVYEELHDGDPDLDDVHGLVETMKAELGKYAELHHLSIYDLYDVSIVDKKTGKLYELPEGYKLMVKFDLQIDTDLFLEVMSFAEDHWQLADHEENQGDGILVIFDHLCPVAFLVQSDDIPTDEEPGVEPGTEDGDKDDESKDDEESEGPAASGDGEGGSKGDSPKTGDESNPALWGVLCIAALAGLLGVLKARKKA